MSLCLHVRISCETVPEMSQDVCDSVLLLLPHDATHVITKGNSSILT